MVPSQRRDFLLVLASSGQRFKPELSRLVSRLLKLLSLLRVRRGRVAVAVGWNRVESVRVGWGRVESVRERERV
jgi:hypothetical protein